jgi:hypothetical protein
MQVLCPNCSALNPLDAQLCRKCGASLEFAKVVTEVEEGQSATPDKLSQAFIGSTFSRTRIATMPFAEVTRLIKTRRRKVSKELGDLPWTDEQIAQLIQDHARGIDRADENAPTNKLLVQLLDRQWDTLLEQRRQTDLLQRMNSIIQLWGVLLILGIIGTCLWTLFGSVLF